jgi:ElaB/YqjD/DUF883 family membrane-anchored ribosome-binding protein
MLLLQRERFMRSRNQPGTALASDRFFGYDSRVAVRRRELSMSEVNKERLMSDIKTVLADAEDLLKQAASATGERASELRETALTRLKQAKEKAADVQVVVVEKGKKAARATDDYVHEHPWASIGIAAGAGVLLGLLINRK